MLRLAAGFLFNMSPPRISATHAPSSEKMKNTSNQVGALLSVLGIERHPAPRFRPAQTLVRIPPAPAGRACSRRPVGAMKIHDLTSLALFGQKMLPSGSRENAAPAETHTLSLEESLWRTPPQRFAKLRLRDSDRDLSKV